MPAEPRRRSAGDLGLQLGSFGASAVRTDQAQLSWRCDPEQSLADWRLVVSDDGSATQTYHVHRALIAAGPRCSEYFVGQFRGGAGFSEGSAGQSTLSFDTAAAEAMPLFLYIHSLA